MAWCVVYLRTGTDRGSKDPLTGKELPARIEIARTDRTDAEAGRSPAIQAESLVGQRVLVFIRLETMDNGDKVGTLVGVVDQGAEAVDEAG